ncbi:MAG: LysR family transcriptional regulator [Burkholderiaceae bacterium]|nr:LysR family transcriptional regulator [Burkholderiaceae bacterium]
MPGLQSYMAFAETAKRGSFAAAARELGSAPSTLAKAVTRLEASLGVKLLHRTTRRVGLTADGERLFQRCQRVLAEVDELHAEAAGTRAAPRGTLRIDMPIVYGRRILLPLLAQLVRRHPELALDARLHDEQVDLVKEGIDVAIRIGALRDSRLVARRFAHQALLLCASPGYLAERGTPKRVDALAAHAAIAFRMPSNGRDRPWQFRARGRAVELHPASRVQLNDGESMVAAACMGLGLAQVPDYMVQRELADGRLVEVLGEHRPATMPISAVYPGARLLPARVRALLEVLDSLRDDGAPRAGDVEAHVRSATARKPR